MATKPIFYDGQPGPEIRRALNEWADYAGDALQPSTSDTSLTVGTGTRTLTVPAGRAFGVGQSVRIARTSNPAQWMQGIVTTYSGTTLTVSVSDSQGSGTYTGWTVTLAGGIGPKGDKGDKGDTGVKGDTGPANTLTIGTVTKGDDADATITGTAPSQTLSLTLPKGDQGDTGLKGDKGDTGDTGPANVLTIGTVQSGPTADAEITGTSPAQTLNLVLPKGDKGDKGDTGDKGDPGDGSVSSVNNVAPDGAGNVELGISDIPDLRDELDSKVDAQPGYGLSQEDYTLAEKQKLAALESSRFKGEFVSLASLTSGVPSPSVGDYANVDAGVGESVQRYIWDASDSEWVLSGSDAVLRQELAGPAGYRKIANQMAPNAYGVPGPLVDVRSHAGPRCEDFFGGYFWGTMSSSTIHRSPDGVGWEQYAQGPVRFSRILPTGDGEVLGMSSSAVYKSSGWSTGSPSWTVVLTNPTQASFLRFGFDGYGDKFIITHYRAGAGFIDSRYVWISTDAGGTWNVVWDNHAEFPGQEDESHLHAACYDPWSGRFYFTEGHGPAVGIRYSDDDGQTWTRMENDLNMSPAFTTMTATDFGIVCGTDGHPNGIFLIRRQRNPDDIGVEYYGALGVEITNRAGVIAFADRGMRDPDTGIVYVGFNTNFADVPPVVFAVGAEGATVVHRGATGHSTMSRYNNVVAAKGKILMHYLEGSGGATQLIGSTSTGGSPRQIDRGNFLAVEGDYAPLNSMRAGYGSKSSGINTIAIGPYADAGDLQGSIAIGYESVAPGNATLSIGHQATCSTQLAIAIGSNTHAVGSSGIAIGSGAETTGPQGGVAIGLNASARGIAIGVNSTSDGIGSIAIGASTEVSGQSYTIAIGQAASATGTSAVAIGREVTSANSSVAIGYGANTTSGSSIVIGRDSFSASGLIGAIAIGREAKSLHSNGIALGDNTETQRNNTVCVGDRNIESTRAGGALYLRSPDNSVWMVLTCPQS